MTEPAVPDTLSISRVPYMAGELATVTITPSVQTSYGFGPTSLTTTTVATEIYTVSNTEYEQLWPSVYITLPKNCKDEVVVGEKLKANPDISGLGVSSCTVVKCLVTILMSCRSSLHLL